MFKHVRIVPGRLGDSGTAAIELALMSPFLVLLTTGGYDFGSVLYEQHRIAGAARAGIQYAMQNASSWTNSSGITSAVRSDANDTTSSLSVTTNTCYCPTATPVCSNSSSCTGSTTAGTYVMVTVSESYTTIMTYPLVTSPFSLSSQAFVRVD